MSEYAQDESSPPLHGSDSNLQNSMDDSANNSIIGKVKSRVSSILPNRLSKWFSPSAKPQNDSLNGSICGEKTTQGTRRRRRIEVEEDNYEDDEDVHSSREYKESNYRIYTNQNQDRDDDNENDDDSQNSEDEYNSSSVKQSRRDLNIERQPPTKKCRLNLEVRDSPVITRHQPLLSSTPAVGNAYLRNSTTTSLASRNSYDRLTHLNLYGNQSKKDPAFNFGQQKESKSVTKSNADIIDLLTNSSYEHDNALAESSNVHSDSRMGTSSRKSLNIPPSTMTIKGSERLYAPVAHLKRQPLSSAKANLSVDVPPRRTSTTIQEVEEQVEGDNDEIHYCGIDKRVGIMSEPNVHIYNGRIDNSNNFGTNKRQKLINGSSFNTTIIPDSNEGISVDSASESGESAQDVIKMNSSNTQQRKTGLFNMSAGGNVNTRNSSRTSSFGNDLNFYSHLEGRKSLFSGANHANPLNNSTLSLTSLNRRQFNASIYGSTSALSDSRLLNTFSPFYKGKTTYGGAAAYNKYTGGVSASTVRITPTLIRPTSSLSTLSSSSNTLGNNANSQVGENSAISSTAKRILDLINDFATPLSEAKKMASNLKSNPNLHIPPQAKCRLNESDLNASRAIRLSQVRTPYSRSAVILQPSGNAAGCGPASGILPPVKELQVPTMSQLLQMKKMQNTTEKARKIAQNSGSNVAISEYTLPDLESSKTSPTNVVEQGQQKHTNKIKNKMIKSLRSSAASKDLLDEEPPPPVNLPNIAFPIMQSVPKIDIELNKTSAPDRNIPEYNSSKLSTATATSNAKIIDSSKSTTLAFNHSPINSLTQTPVSIADDKKKQLLSIQSDSTLKSSNIFTFSEPIPVDNVLLSAHSVTKDEIDKYKFSSPIYINVPPCAKEHNIPATQPQLKEGSCLDALSKNFALPPTLSQPNATEETSSNKAAPSFGNQFKKLPNEWECDSCMLQNKSDTNKCVACETLRQQNSSTSQKVLNPSISESVTSSFGQQFKKSSNEWECDTCMIRNKEETTKCIACETPRKSVVTQSTAAIPHIKNSFGDAFKPKSDTWECQTCMIPNKNDVNECVACQTKKPGSTNTSHSAVPSTQFKFGLTATDTKNVNADAGFKTLAAQQKVSKWECDACMTRNDANRTKCACCEQPKPGSSSAESTNITKFQFGATSASKFSFGFGTEANTPKEEDIRKQLSSKSEEPAKPLAPSLELGTSQTPSSLGGFQFGIKPDVSSNSVFKKDETDSNIQGTGLKSDISATTGEPKVCEKSNAVPPPSGFAYGLKSPARTTAITATTTTSTTMSSATVANVPNVKFSLPSTIANTIENINDKSKGAALPAFSFGVGSATSTTTGGFSFGNKIDTNAAATVEKENKTADSNAFKAPATTVAAKTSGFVFGSTAVKDSSTSVSAPFVSSTFNTTSSAATTTSTTAAVKPMFSFGTNTSTTSGLNTKSTPAFNTFSFGVNSIKNSATTTTANTIFATVTSTITTTTDVTTKTSSLSTSATSTTTPASTNIFGSFGGGAGLSTASASPIFGSSVNPPANNNLSTVSSSTNNPNRTNTSQFGGFRSKETSNVFGSFGGIGGGETKNCALVKPNETKPILPVFGNVAPSSTSQSSQSNSTGFMFGSNKANDTALATTASTTGSVTSTSTTWPKNTLVFGSTASSTSAAITATAGNANENKEVAKPSLFGTFGSTSTNSNNQQQTSSIFGAPVPNSIGAPLSASGTTASGPTSFSTNLFGTNSAPATVSIFGANSSGNAATPAPAFGSSPFGGAASSTSATPTFGSTAASGTTFGSFGGLTNNTTTNTTDVKKPEAAFNFGAAPATQCTSGGFNFGTSSCTTKPAFNFGGTSTSQQPSFNFTGTTESQSSTKPFQFGASPPAPVFSFNRGVLEGTSNAPFQFNAGAAPVSSNIFAPSPTPGTQTAQQAKRKIRAPIRRVTQR